MVLTDNPRVALRLGAIAASETLQWANGSGRPFRDTICTNQSVDLILM